MALTQPPTRWATGFFPEGSVKLTTHLHIAPRLRMSKVIPLLKLCALMARTGTLPLPLPLPRGRTIRVRAQSIRNLLSPQHNTKNVD